MKNEKRLVHDFWNQASCGETLHLRNTEKQGYIAQAEMRYRLEPYILDFAGFEEIRGLRLLEIGVGLGADHQKFAEAGATLWGIDLTERAVEHTRRRLVAFGLHSHLAVGDAEALDFENETFDRIYSWGVLHHSPDTPKAIGEVWRVLKRGGEAKIMIYHKWSMVGMILWIRYGLLRLRPFTSLKTIYARYLESPGTKPIRWRRRNGCSGRFRRCASAPSTDPRRFADLRCRPAAPRGCVEPGAQGLAARVNPTVFPEGWFVHAD